VSDCIAIRSLAAISNKLTVTVNNPAHRGITPTQKYTTSPEKDRDTATGDKFSEACACGFSNIYLFILTTKDLKVSNIS